MMHAVYGALKNLTSKPFNCCKLSYSDLEFAFLAPKEEVQIQAKY